MLCSLALPLKNTKPQHKQQENNILITITLKSTAIIIITSSYLHIIIIHLWAIHFSFLRKKKIITSHKPRGVVAEK